MRKNLCKKVSGITLIIETDWQIVSKLSTIEKYFVMHNTIYWKTIKEKLVRIDLMLAIATILIVISCPSYAETSENILKCNGKNCFNKPLDIAISNDDSFFLVTDSDESSGSFLRRFDVQGGITANVKNINLGTGNTGQLNVSINKNNNLAVVYNEPSEANSTTLQIVDLIDNSVKSLHSISSEKLQVGVSSFGDANGETLIVGTVDSVNPEIVTIDVKNDQILNRTPILDLARSVHVSPDFKFALITHGDLLAQSVSLYDIQNNSVTEFDIDESLAFSLDDLSSRVQFNASGNKAVISTAGGNHVLHLLDIQNKKFITKVLDKTIEGPSFTTISPDGKTAVVVGNILDITTGFKLYKLTVARDNSVNLSGTTQFLDNSIVLDAKITPDQSKILILLLKDNLKQLLILNLKDLSKISSLTLSSDNTQSSLQVSPSGLFAATRNTNEGSVSFIRDLDPGPTLKNISPTASFISGGSSFVIDGFIDPTTNSLNNTKVCFRSSDFCASNISVSKDGRKISGIIPRFPQAGFADVILISSGSDKSTRTSRYEDIFQFVSGTLLGDTFPPAITLFAPGDFSITNTKRVLVLGKVDGTGSKVRSVKVNSKDARLGFEGISSQNVANFISHAEFDSDGVSEIVITATDDAANISEKIVKVKIDTVLPSVSATAESTGNNTFTVSGTVNGTGSDVASILINSQQVAFDKNEIVNFSATTSTLPIKIIVSDSAGNKNQLSISNPLVGNNSSPVINILSPSNGSVFKANSINISFTVTDESPIKEVLVNGAVTLPSSGNQYSATTLLNPGQNLITIEATNEFNNSVKTSIKVGYSPENIQQPSNQGSDQTDSETPQEKEVLTLPNDTEDLSQEIINQLSVGRDEININSFSSVEISNPPPIPEGNEATIEIPEGTETIQEGEIPEVPKGFSFGTDINFEDENLAPPESDSNQNVALLVDSSGRAFVVGFAFRSEDSSNNNLISTFTVPSDASEGEAKISILSGNESIASILISIKPENSVQNSKSSNNIGKPQIIEPIIPIVKKAGSLLRLTIKGKNFIGRSAIIDGKLEKLVSKAQFFTNITFVPDEGIKLKKFRLINNSIIITAELKGDLKPGIKLFNIITPKGSDIGAIVFPDPIVNGRLQATANPENLIFEDANEN